MPRKCFFNMILKFVQMEEALSTEACMTSIVDNLSSLTDVRDSQSNYALNMFLVYLWKVWTLQHSLGMKNYLGD